MYVHKQNWFVKISMVLFLTFSPYLAMAGDLDDGIGEFLDEPISADDNLGGKDTNVSFIVTNAIAKAKSKANGQNKGDQGSSSKAQTNFNDGSGDVNENSVVVEAGSRVDKVYNIIIER